MIKIFDLKYIVLSISLPVYVCVYVYVNICVINFVNNLCKLPNSSLYYRYTTDKGLVGTQRQAPGWGRGGSHGFEY